MIVMIAGMTHAMRSLPTDRPVIDANTTMMMLGGMSTPSVPPSATSAAAELGL